MNHQNTHTPEKIDHINKDDCKSKEGLAQAVSEKQG